MNVEKTLAGIFAGAGGLYLLYLGHVTAGSIIISSMMAFFVGEANGTRKVSESGS